MPQSLKGIGIVDPNAGSEQQCRTRHRSPERWCMTGWAKLQNQRKGLGVLRSLLTGLGVNLSNRRPFQIPAKHEAACRCRLSALCANYRWESSTCFRRP